MKSIICLVLPFFMQMNLTVDTDKFYAVLSGESVEQIDKLISELELQKATSMNNAYKGALIAKKAGFETNVTTKIKTFKSGVQLLESEINKSPKLLEYRFLRLSIQEHCPKILKYNDNINEDVKLIINDYSNQSKKLKSIIINYAKNSNSLDAALLK